MSADHQIAAEMSDVQMSLTAKQYVLLMEVVRALQALPKALSNEDDEDDAEETSSTVTPASSSEPATPARNESPDHLVNLEPELTVVPTGDSKKNAPWHTRIVIFDVGSIALELYDDSAVEDKDLKDHSIARFALVRSHAAYKQLSNGASEAEFTLKTLAFSSTKRGKSVFRDIIPHTTQNGDQM
jgi:vacuolar protein sorting-associated protein 13A/C